MSTDTTATNTSSPKRARSRTFKLVVGAGIAAGLASGAAFAATSGIASASSAPAWAHFGPGAQNGFTHPGFGNWGPGNWGSGSAANVEHFTVENTSTTDGPGSIILTGPLNEGGIENPTRTVDGAAFADGTFTIDHSTGQPTTSFDPKTCVGTINQQGPFTVKNGTGAFKTWSGKSGTYNFAAIYTLAKGTSGCGHNMTAYIERINAVLPLS